MINSASVPKDGPNARARDHPSRRAKGALLRMRSEINARALKLTPRAWSNTGDRRDHHTEPGERPPDRAALSPDRRRAGTDLRADGGGELRPRRIPHDRHVRDVLPVRVLCDRSI